MARQKNKVIGDLIVENHPENYTGPEWLTLVVYTNNHSKLVVVDSLDKNYLWGYNFDDFTDNEKLIFIDSISDYWKSTLYDEPLRKRIPIHEWFVERDLIDIFGSKLVAYSTGDILRVIGPVREVEKLSEKINQKRRKRILIK